MASGKSGPPPRLKQEEARDLPRHWVTEIQRTSRPGAASQVAEAVALAIAAFADEDYEQAVRQGQLAKELTQRSAQVSELLGLALYHRGSWKDALSELLGHRRSTGSRDHNHVIADLYRAVGRPDRALETVAEVSPDEVDRPTWVELMIVAAGALADKGQVDRALTMLARADPGAGVVEPYFLRHWYMRAELLEQAGRWAEAKELWQRIVNEDPEFFDASERLSGAPGGNAGSPGR